MHVPWLELARSPKRYLDVNTIPKGFKVLDPSKMTVSMIYQLWSHWSHRAKRELPILIFKRGRRQDLGTDTWKEPSRVVQKRKVDDYVDVDLDDVDVDSDDVDVDSDDVDVDSDDVDVDSDNVDADSDDVDVDSDDVDVDSDNVDVDSDDVDVDSDDQASDDEPDGANKGEGTSNSPVQPPPSKRPRLSEQLAVHDGQSPAANTSSRLEFLRSLSQDPFYAALLDGVLALPASVNIFHFLQTYLSNCSYI